MEETQREYYLNEQLKAIQKELGEIEDGKDETSNLNKAIQKAKMPKEVQKKCMAELKKLKNMSPMSAEATVVRNYLDWMIDIPWFKKDKVDIDLKNALKVLDDSQLPELIQQEVRLNFFGDYSSFGETVIDAILDAERSTAFEDHNLKLNIALGYGGRADIIQATKLIANEIKLDKLMNQKKFLLMRLLNCVNQILIMIYWFFQKYNLILLI